MSPIRVRRGVCRALFLLAFVSFQSLADVSSLVVDPTNPNIVYAGTTEGGVLKSTDGGVIWTRAGLADTPVARLAIDPGVPSLLYALTSTGLFKSANAGETWTAIATNGSLPNWGMIERPIFWSVDTLALARRTDPAQPATVYAGMTYQASDWFNQYMWGDVFTSTNGGEGWVGFLADANDPFSSPWLSAPIMAAATQTDTTPAMVYTGVHPAVGGYQVCGMSGCARIDQSPDGPLVLAVDPQNPLVVYAGMNGTGVYKSIDGGVTWTGGGGSGAATAIVVDPLTPTTLYVATGNQGVLKSTDGGASWTAMNAGLEPGVWALAIDPVTPAVLYAATASGVFKSTNGGGSWNPTGMMQRLQSLTVTAGMIGGTESTGTVTLNAPAPTGGAVVMLSSSNATLASVPGSVTVPAGTTSASFPISTVPVLASSVVTISANLDGLAKSAALVLAPAIASMVLSTQPVIGGMTLSVTITFGLPVPAGGATVALTSSNPAVATVPASVTAAAGATTASFSLSTVAVGADTMVTLSAAYGGETHSRVFTVVATAVASLRFSPVQVVAGSTSTGTVTLMAPAPAGGWVVSLVSMNKNVATAPPSVTVPAGATSASFTVSTNAALPGGGITVWFLAGGTAQNFLDVTAPAATVASLALDPANVTGGSASMGIVTLSAAAPAGGALVALSSNNPAVATVPASVTVPMGATSASFPVSTNVVSAATTATISAAYGAGSRSTVLAVIPAALSSLGLSPASVSAGSASTGTVTLSVPAPAGGAQVSLASSATAVAAVPAAVIVAAGALTANFPVTTAACTSGSATVSGTYGGVTRSAGLNVSSNADNVVIEQATYFANKRELRVSARSSDSNATLQAYVTSSGALIGALRNLGDGRYSGQFVRSVNPQQITVRSTSCGSASGVVDRKG